MDSESGVGGITHDGGRDKVWLWGPAGGVFGTMSNCAIGVYASRNVLMESGDAHLHPFNSGLLLSLPLVEDLQGVRPMVIKTGSVMGCVAMRNLGVWEGESWGFEEQKILPPGFLYVLIHTYPKGDRYLKQTMSPRFGDSVGADIERRLMSEGIGVV